MITLIFLVFFLTIIVFDINVDWKDEDYIFFWFTWRKRRKFIKFNKNKKL